MDPGRVTQVFRDLSGRLGFIPPKDIDRKAYRLAILEPDDRFRKEMTDRLTKEGYSIVYPAETVQGLEDILAKKDASLILTSLDLGKANQESGLQLIQRMRIERKYATNFMVLGTDPSEGTEAALITLGAEVINKRNLSWEVFSAKLARTLVNIDLMTQSNVDSLMGIANKGALYNFLGIESGTLSRDYHDGKDTSLSVVVMDINHFKQFNDVHGHIEGDYVLKSGANYLSRSLRPRDLVARYGGEEIVMVMPNTDFNQALRIYSRVTLGFKQDWKASGHYEKFGRFIEFSSGIATLDLGNYREIYGERGVNLRDPTIGRSLANLMMGCADRGLYQIKEHGRNGCYPEDCLSLFYKKVDPTIGK